MIFLLYWDLWCILVVYFPTSREHRNIVQLCTLKALASKAYRRRECAKWVAMEETRGQGNISIWNFACFKALALLRSARGIAHVHCTLYWRCEVAKRVPMEETLGQGNISIWSNRDATLSSEPSISNYHRLCLPGLLLRGARVSRHFDLNIVESESMFVWVE